MRRAIPALAALFAASAGHGQLTWVMDTTFRAQFEWGTIADIEFRPNGLWVSGMWKYLDDDMNWPRYMATLDEQGHRITSFATAGGGGTMTAWGNRFYVRNGQGIIRKFFADGDMDWSFNTSTIFSSSIHGGDFHVYPDGKVLMTGGHDLWSLTDTSFLGSQYCLVRWDTTGLPDPAFQHRQCMDGITQKILRLPDGKFLLSGQQDIYDGQTVGHVLRVHEDGSIDTTFRTTIDYGYATDYYFYPNGRILCSGWFHTPELPDDTVQFLRLMPDGSVDLSFNYDMNFEFFPDIEYPPAVTQGMFALDSATLLIGGSFTNLNDEWVGGLFAMDTAGNVLPDYFPGLGCDTVFGPSNIFELGLRDFEMAPDGSLYAYGFFRGFDDGYINDTEQCLIVKLKQVDVGEPEGGDIKPGMELVPNPGGERLTVRSFGTGPSVSMIVLDLAGKPVLASKLVGAETTLTTEALAPGLYVVQLSTFGKPALRSKWIKQ